MSTQIFVSKSFLAFFFLAALSGAAATAADPAPLGTASIRAPFGPSEIVVSTTARLAGAIGSITWNGVEFIDSADHGRELQSASSFDNTPTANPETFNPTEAGSRDDGAGPSSTSRLLEFNASGAFLRTRTQMAFWLRPGERSLGQLARNTEPLSRHELIKEVRIGGWGLPNALDYTITFRLPQGEPHQTSQLEVLTGYMPARFSSFWQFNHATRKLEPLSDGPGEIPEPVALATPDGQYAMATISLDPPVPVAIGPTYGRFRFPAEKVVKWNCVFRGNQGVPAGDHRFHLAVLIGTRDDVERGLAALYQPR